MSDSDDSSSGSQEDSGGNGPEPLECVICDAEIDPRGYQGHLVQKHDFSQENAKKTFEKQKETATVGPSGVGRGPAADGPTMSELAEVMQSGVEGISAARMFREALKGDDKEDTLDSLIKAREAGLIDDSDDGLKELARSIQQQTQVLQQQQTQPAADGGEASPMTALAAEGITEPDAWEKAIEIEKQRKGLDWKHRALDMLSEVDPDSLAEAVTSLGGMLSKAGQNGQQPRQIQQPEQPQESEPEFEYETDADDPAEDLKSPQAAKAEASDGGESDES